MDISNPTQFASFISANNLQMLDATFRQLVECINNYAASCTCWKLEDKQRIYAQCCNLYIMGVKHIVPRFKNEILAKIPDRQISFYADNGTLIGIVSR